MPTFRHGKNTALFFNQYDLSQFFREATYTKENDIADTTAFQSTNKTGVAGIPGGTVSAAGMFSGAAAADVDPILAGVIGQESSNRLILCNDGGALLSRRCQLALVHESTYEVNAAVADMVSVSAEFFITDGSDFGAVVHALEAESATGNDAGTDFFTTASAGGVMIVSMVANTRDAGSIDIKLQDATTLGGAYSDIAGAAFTNIGFGVATSERIVLPTTTSVRQFVRCAWTVTGGLTGSYTFVVGFAKR